MPPQHDSSPEGVLFDAARAYVRRLYGPSRRPKRIKIVLDDDELVCLPVPVPWQLDRTAGPRHSQDFRSINWFGQRYSFSAGQAAVVRLLWQAWTNDTPEMGQDALLEGSGSESAKLSDVFKDHAAWGTLIVAGGSRGTYRLADPEDDQP
jgi:hypothetical protein